MKKAILILTMICVVVIATAQQKPDFPRTRTLQVLSDYATWSRSYMGLPSGTVPFFPSYVPDSLKCKAYFNVLPGSMTPGLYRYDCTSGTWVMVGNSAHVDSVLANVAFTNQSNVFDTLQTFKQINASAPEMSAHLGSDSVYLSSGDLHGPDNFLYSLKLSQTGAYLGVNFAGGGGLSASLNVTNSGLIVKDDFGTGLVGDTLFTDLTDNSYMQYKNVQDMIRTAIDTITSLVPGNGTQIIHGTVDSLGVGGNLSQETITNLKGNILAYILDKGQLLIIDTTGVSTTTAYQFQSHLFQSQFAFYHGSGFGVGVGWGNQTGVVTPIELNVLDSAGIKGIKLTADTSHSWVIADTWHHKGIGGNENFSSHLDSLSYTQKIYVDNAISTAISGGASPTGSAGGDLSGAYPNPTVAKFNGQLPSYYLNYANLTGKPTAPVIVASYAAMIAIGAPSSGFTTFLVTADEKENYTNSEYHYWSTGVLNWIATTSGL